MKPLVAILMGSESDLPIMTQAKEALDSFGIENSVTVMSAHRTPHAVADFAENARKNGIRVIIAGAGGAAHLGGVIASLTELPVIGVPIAVGGLGGQDALYSIVQMPKGVPVATVAIGGAWNAGVLAAQILGDPYLDRVRDYKNKMRDGILKKLKS